MEGDGSGEIIASLILLPITLVTSVFRWFSWARNRGTPREKELAIASHGVAFLALAVFVVWIMGPAKFAGFMLAAPAAFPVDWLHWVPASAFGVVVALGLYWFITGCARSMAFAGDRDARFILRALVKIAAGVAVWWCLWFPPATWPRELLAWLTYAHTQPAGAVCCMAIIGWLCITGLARFLLVAVPAVTSAEKIMAGLLKERNRPLVPARTRRFFF